MSISTHKVENETKTKIILLISIVLGLGLLAFSPSKTFAASCSNEVLKFFPESKISSVIGRVKSSSGSKVLKSYNCTFTIDKPAGGLAGVNVSKIDSTNLAKSVFTNQYSGSKINVGDASVFKARTYAAALKDNFIFSVHWYCFCTDKQYLSESQAKTLLSYAVSQVSPADLPKPPTIASITPATVSAGTYDAIDKQTGFVLYRDAEIKNFKITGTNLQGAKLSVGKGIDRRDIARFVGVNVSADGTTLTGWMYVSTGAPAGKSKITVTNAANLSASADINITITGTQYLKRKFANTRVTFRGDWPDAAPNSEVLEIEKGINMGLTAINKPAYNNLGIHIRVFAKDYWIKGGAKVTCGNENVRGCSYGTSSGINISTGFSENAGNATDARYLASEILHESVHKLDNCYGGAYFAGFVSCFKKINLNFTKEWRAAVGDKSKCKYLPLFSNLAWNDGTKRVAHCGFARSYGLNSESDDMATMAEVYYFYPEILETGDGPTDPRYQQKINILKKYGFL